MMMIILNTMVMAADSFGQSALVTRILGSINSYFTLLFLAEATAKLYALGLGQYFRVSCRGHGRTGERGNRV